MGDRMETLSQADLARFLPVTSLAELGYSEHSVVRLAVPRAGQPPRLMPSIVALDDRVEASRSFWVSSPVGGEFRAWLGDCPALVAP